MNICVHLAGTGTGRHVITDALWEWWYAQLVSGWAGQWLAYTMDVPVWWTLTSRSSLWNITLRRVFLLWLLVSARL